MKFQTKGSELNNVLGTVIKGFNNKEDNSYVALKLDVEEEKLKITARSRATFFEGTVDVHSIEIHEDEPTVYHLDGVKLKQLVSILPSAPIDVTFEISDKTRSFTIKTSVSKYKLPVLSETPLAPAPEVTELATVDANDLMKVIKDLIKIVSNNPAHQEHPISCMHFKVTEDNMKLTATDTYALGSVVIDSSGIDVDEDGRDVLVRHTEVSTLSNTFDTGETLTIVGADGMFGYIDEEGTLALVGEINLVPLDISQIQAFTKKDNVIEIDKSELTSAIETVAKLSPSDETVDLELEKGQVRVSNRYGDYIDVSVSKEKLDSPGKASFATSVLLKAISPSNNGKIRLEFGDLSENSKGVLNVISLHADDSADENASLIAARLNV